MALTIAVTGATGFVGKAVVPKLLAAGHQLRLLVREPAKHSFHSDVWIVRGGLDDASALFELVAGADVVLHMAGAISAANRAGFFHTNKLGTEAVLMAAQAGGVKRFVLLSSLAARQPEISAYAASKKAAEIAVAGLSQMMQVLVLRPAAVYGPRDLATLPLLKALMSRVAILPGRPFSRFSLIHVDDLSRICVEAVASPVVGMREVDDASGGHTWPELAAITQANFSRPARLLFIPFAVAISVGALGSIAAWILRRPMMVSIDKMRELYEPNWVIEGENWPRENPVSLFDGLPEAITWYQANGMLPSLGKDNRSPSTEGPKDL
jgi:nucleoside-diphosphate-sugar epimerase